MAIAKAFFDTYQKGRVFGVTYGDSLNVEYAVAECFEECRAFQGSKYVQSDMNGTIKQVIDSLEDGFPVLFVGTPCAVASVKKTAQAKGVYGDMLWLVDLICHGTVDKRIWKDYLAWLEKRNHAKVVEYSFRYKPVSWRGYPVYVRFSDGKKLIDTYESRTYIRAFLKCISMRSGCFQCPFKTTERCGDVTLGDFWGAEALFGRENVARGVSLCLENTENGTRILKKLQELAKDEVPKLERLDDEMFMQRQDNLKRALTKPKEYELFQQNYEKHGFEVAIRKAGIFTLRGRIRAAGIAVLKKTGIYSILKK